MTVQSVTGDLPNYRSDFVGIQAVRQDSETLGGRFDGELTHCTDIGQDGFIGWGIAENHGIS